MTREEFTVQAEAVSGSLRRFLTALCCGDCSTADDIAQEALIKAYLSSEGLRDETKFRAWIFRIAYNCFISHRRALGAAPAAVSTEDESARSVYSGDSADGAFRYQALYAALDRLGPRERSAILLYYMQGYSVRETAGIVEASEEAVKQYLSRGRRHLRGLLEKNDMDNTEDKKIRELFGAYHPEQSSARDFMRELERRMDAVEFIRERQTEAARARKTALAVASATGFLAGFLFSRFLPSIIVFLENLGLANALPGSTDVVGWSLVAAATVASAVGTFELSLSLPVRKQGF